MELNNKNLIYPLAGTVILIWGLTFLSTKVLLGTLSPTEVLFYRYVIAYAVLFAISPRPLALLPWKDERIIAASGIFGITLNFILENSALMYSTASNVSLLVTTAPMLTGLFAHFLTKDEKLSPSFAWGCIFGLGGVTLIVFNGHVVLKLNPLGDLLALCAAMSFVSHSLIVRKIRKDITLIMIARKTVFYSLLSLLPLLATPVINWHPEVLRDPAVIGNLLFLGVFASALCLILWNKVIWSLGAVKANNMIYLSPFVTMVSAAIILGERITPLAVLGAVMILAGVFVSQRHKVALSE